MFVLRSKCEYYYYYYSYYYYSYYCAGKKKSCNRLRWTSTSPTRTETFSPARAISCGSFLAVYLLFSFFEVLQNVDLWIKPLVSTPTSTKMPN